MHAGDQSTDSRYVAFISYNQKDRAWAQWLHRAIETYRVPAAVRGARDANQWALRPVFLDREELSASSDLAGNVREALQNSAHLIVICSPNAVQSRWVNEEIGLFVAAGRRENIHCLVVAGDPASWSDARVPATQHCFPPALKSGVHDASPTTLPEPLAADVRPGMDDRESAKLKIIAALLGVRLDDLRQRDQARRQRRLLWVAVASSTGALVLAGLSIFALLARNAAERARILAEQKTQTAERTSQFMQSLFAVNDPSEARGSTITAREILDRGAAQIQTQLRDEPLIRAELLTTLGDVNSNLGLYKSGADLLAQAVAIPGKNPDSELKALIGLAETRYRLSDYAAADGLFARANAIARKNGNRDAALQIRLDLGWAETMLKADKIPLALQLLGSTLERIKAARPEQPLQFGRVLEGLGEAHFYEGRLDESRRDFAAALEVWEKNLGEDHPRVSVVLSQLGAVEYMRGNRQAAQSYYERALPIDRKVLGNRHPEIAGPLNNLARVYLERRQFGRALALLEESRSILLDQKDEMHDDMVFVSANIGLAEAGLGRIAQAQAMLEKGLRAARANKHRLTAPILVDLAHLDCLARRSAQGLARLAEARPLMQARYPDDPWRMAIVDSVEGECWLMQNDLPRAEALLTRSAPVMLQKWRPDEMYGFDVVTRMIRFHEASNNAPRAAEFRRLLTNSP